MSPVPARGKPCRQTLAWEAEYCQPGTRRIESSYSLQPEPCVLWFFTWLKQQGRLVGRLLDLGCGRGRNSLPFLRAGWTVDGLDAAAAAVRDFRSLARPGSRLRVRCGDFGERLPYPDAVFDAALEITAADNLGSRVRFRRLWREAARVLKPGGYLLSYFFTPADGYYGPRLRTARTRADRRLYDPQAGMWFRFYTEEDILRAAGGRLRVRARRHYRYPGPMFGQTRMRDLQAVIFQRSV